MFAPVNTAAIKTTSYKAVVPFYVYAAVSFLVAAVLLFTSGNAFTGHYFHPHILAVTHIMALGWGTMIILGASHQLVPVLIEGKLYSEKLAYFSFAFAAAGIPLLVYGFYVFNMGLPAQWGGLLVVLSVLTYLINIGASIAKSRSENVHGVFVFTAMLWLFLTTLLGLSLVYNFTADLLPKNSLYYLSLHAHLGVAGWFLLLVLGVASRLIPMFLISKHTNPRLLWTVYALVNAALLLYIVLFFSFPHLPLRFIPLVFMLMAVALFISYCYRSYRLRLRRQVDDQVKISLLSAIMLLLPALLLFAVITLLLSVSGEKTNLILCYGFLVFFGWVTAIILGMTFKTLPFIIWNKVYRHRSALGKTPNPKELFSSSVFKAMSIVYLLGFILFACGILSLMLPLLKTGAVLLICAAVLYNWNVFKVITHKPAVVP